MIFYINALLLQVLLSFSFANGSHILCKAEPPLGCKTVCNLGNLLFISNRFLNLIFWDWAGQASELDCKIEPFKGVPRLVLLNLYFVKLLFQFTKVVIFIVIKITFKFKLPKLQIFENNRLSFLSLRRVLCEDKKWKFSRIIWSPSVMSHISLSGLQT